MTWQKSTCCLFINFSGAGNSMSAAVLNAINTRQRSEANAISQNNPSCLFITVFDKNLGTRGGGACHMVRFDATPVGQKQISPELYLKAATLAFSSGCRRCNSWGSPAVIMLMNAWGGHYVTATTRLRHLHLTAHAAHTSPPYWNTRCMHDRTCRQEDRGLKNKGEKGLTAVFSQGGWPPG